MRIQGEEITRENSHHRAEGKSIFAQVNINKEKGSGPWIIGMTQYAVKTRMGRIPGMKKTNQDNFIIKKNLTGVPSATLLAVCDGHGEHGHFVSEFIKKVFP